MNPGQHDGLEARRRTETSAAAQRQHRSASQTAPTRCEESTGLGKRHCPVTACRSVEESGVAPRGEAETPVPLCRFARATRTPRLLAIRTASRGIAADRVPGRGIGTNQVQAMTLPADSAVMELVQMGKHRWIIERDYQALSRNSGWATTNDVVRAASIITPP